MQQRERKNIYLIEDYSSSEGENDNDGRKKKLENRRMRRSNRRANRGDVTIYAARKRLLLNAAKTPLQLDRAKRVEKLGPGGCPACMSTPCKHIPVVNVEVCAWMGIDRCRSVSFRDEVEGVYSSLVQSMHQ